VTVVDTIVFCIHFVECDERLTIEDLTKDRPLMLAGYMGAIGIPRGIRFGNMRH